jgi:spore coat polysaccharide biosynthesis protein SpsF
LRRDCVLMAAIDDGSDLRLACDFVYYPPVSQALALGWAGARTVPRIGWEWALLGLNPHLTPVRAPGTRPTLLVAMGGSDPLQLTERAARALTPIDSTYRVRFVIGSGVKDAQKLAARIVAMKSNYETVEGADDLSTEYASADLALCAFGVTAYELAAFGVPAIYLNISDDHARSASAFGVAGMGCSLGLPGQVSDEHILGAVRTLMNNPGRRREMRSAGLATMDGGGAARIAADLAQALREEKQPVRASR